jgi:hypothetical protein
MASAYDCCNEIIGGLIHMTAKFAAGGVGTYEGMGEIRLQPQGVSRASGATSNGSVWATETARPIRAIFNFANRCDSDPMLLYNSKCQLNVSIYEDSRGITHQLTNALIVGDAEINLQTGEVTGMEVVCSARDYTRRPPVPLAAGLVEGGPPAPTGAR